MAVAPSLGPPYPPNVPLVFVSASALRAGDHAFAPTRSRVQLARLARAFLDNAERARARALFLVGSPGETAVDGDALLAASTRRGGVVLEEAGPMLAPERTFRPDRFVQALESASEDAVAEGFSGVHVLVEASWSIDGLDDPDRRWDLEEISHDLDVLHRGDTLLVCQYDERRFDPEALERARRAHPIVVDPAPEEFVTETQARIRRDRDALHVWGELDRGTAHLLIAAHEGEERVTVDLGETTFFDVGAYQALREIVDRGCAVTLRNARPVVRKVVSLLDCDAPSRIQIERSTE